MRYPSCHTLVVAFALLAVGSPDAVGQKLKIAEVVWGFDGRVKPNQFNPVSILIDNQGQDAFDGNITLREAGNTGSRIGPRFVELAYIEPQGRRWVQFVPYLGSAPDLNEWKLSWRGGGGLLTRANVTQSAMVMLVSSGGLGSGGKGVKRLDESMFPTTGAATGALDSAVLDHVPRWEQPRRQAFYDWLRQGGQLHLLQSENGEYPVFANELAVLNGPQERQRVGSGVIFRYPMQSSQLDSGFPKRARAVEAAFRKLPGEGADEELEAEIEARRQRAEDSYLPSLQTGWDAAGRAQSTLKEITQPDHNWGLIYFLSSIYILIIFPGCYLIGRRRVHYLVTYGCILGSALLFSLAFLYVGQRGYGEKTEVNAVAIARNIEGDRWDVMQWSNVFVTSGDTYPLAHSGDGVVYATGDGSEAVNGSITRETRADGQVERMFAVDIPPFSNRPYVHRQTVQLSETRSTIEAIEIGEEVSAVTIAVGSRFRKLFDQTINTVMPANEYSYEGNVPRSLPILRMVYRDSMYSLNFGEGKTTLKLGARLGSINQQINTASLTNYAGSMGFWYDREELRPEQRYAQLFHAMVAHHFDIFSDADIAGATLPPDRVRLLIYAKMPPEMFISGEIFGNQKGYVLYSQDLPIETTP